jgi:flavin-dependent dehydrogenase
MESSPKLARLAADVAIVGGGPAGAAAALTLRRYAGLRVVLLERSHYDGPRIGESVSPALRPLLEYLQVWDAFCAQGHAIAHGTAAAWGSAGLQWHSFLLGGQGEGWHLDRARFDEMLARAAAESGSEVLPGTRVIGLQHDPRDASWRIQARSRLGREYEISAGFLIDATGSRAAVAAQLGARRRIDDRLVAIFAFARMPEGMDRPRYTVIESVAQGWWYAAPLPSGGAVVTCLTDAEVVREKRLYEPASWSAELAATRHMRGYMDGAQIVAPLRVRLVHSSLAEPVCGPGWLAAGDAAASFDPLSAMGVGHAIYSGIQGARAAHAYLAGKQELLDEYAAGVSENFSKYRGIRHTYYLQEKRWPDHPFWAARQHQD